jgi:drug/metabolite transporter (DMT)-like permease
LKKINKEYLKWALPSGVILGSAIISQMVGYRYGAGPGASAVLENLALIVIPILLFVFVKQKPTWTKITAAVLCFIGSAVIALSGSEGDLLSVSLGKWLACAAGILYGINFVITGTSAKKLDSGVFVFIQVGVQTILALAYALIGEKVLMAQENIFNYSLEIEHLLIIAGLGVVATGICWMLRAHCLKKIPIMIASVIMPFSTVLTGVWSILGGLEAFTWDLLIGGLLVVGAIFLAQLGDKVQPADEEPKISNGEEKEASNQEI